MKKQSEYFKDDALALMREALDKFDTKTEAFADCLEEFISTYSSKLEDILDSYAIALKNEAYKDGYKDGFMEAKNGQPFRCL